MSRRLVVTVGTPDFKCLGVAGPSAKPRAGSAARALAGDRHKPVGNIPKAVAAFIDTVAGRP